MSPKDYEFLRLERNPSVTFEDSHTLVTVRQYSQFKDGINKTILYYS